MVLPLVFVGCEIDYMNNRRSHFKGKILDQDQNSIENAHVELKVETSGFLSSNYHVVKSAYTDVDGVFSFLTIEPRNEVLYLEITNFSEGYNSVRLMRSGSERGPLYDFGELILNVPANLQITFINESGRDVPVYVESVYFSYTPLRSLPPGWSLDTRWHTNEEESEQIQQSTSIRTDSSENLRIRTVLGSEVLIRYSIGEPLNESDDIQEINFNITESETQYEVIY